MSALQLRKQAALRQLSRTSSSGRSPLYRENITRDGRQSMVRHYAPDYYKNNWQPNMGAFANPQAHQLAHRAAVATKKRSSWLPFGKRR